MENSIDLKIASSHAAGVTTMYIGIPKGKYLFGDFRFGWLRARDGWKDYQEEKAKKKLRS